MACACWQVLLVLSVASVMLLASGVSLNSWVQAQKTSGPLEHLSAASTVQRMHAIVSAGWYPSWPDWYPSCPLVLPLPLMPTCLYSIGIYRSIAATIVMRPKTCMCPGFMMSCCATIAPAIAHCAWPLQLGLVWNCTAGEHQTCLVRSRQPA